MIMLTRSEYDALLEAKSELEQLRQLTAQSIADLRENEERMRHPHAAAFISRITRREPDQVIGGHDDPYLRRWWVVPRNPLQNVYLHQFLRSDDDRAHHTHPWAWNCSLLLRGQYREWHGDTFTDRKAGDWKFRWGPAPHRIELTDGPCWTLFLTGPRVRTWGFLCPQGFVDWKSFTAADDPGSIGKGCDQ
jgi:hypothetical protein